MKLCYGITRRELCFSDWTLANTFYTVVMTAAMVSSNLCPDHAVVSVLWTWDLCCHQHPGSTGVSRVVSIMVSMGHSWLYCGQRDGQFPGCNVLRAAITVLSCCGHCSDLALDGDLAMLWSKLWSVTP